MSRGHATSPYVYEALDYQRNAIRITVTFDNTTRALSGATIFRDPACAYTKIYVGLGADGRPDSTLRAVPIPAGTNTVTPAVLAMVGLTTIEQVLAYQITAGP